MKVLLSFFLLSSLVACSGSKSTNEADQTEAGAEMAETDFSEDFSEDFGTEGDAFAAETGFEEPAAEGGFEEPTPVDEVAEVTDMTMSAGDQNEEMGGMPEAGGIQPATDNLPSCSPCWALTASLASLAAVSASLNACSPM